MKKKYLKTFLFALLLLSTNSKVYAYGGGFNSSIGTSASSNNSPIDLDGHGSTNVENINSGPNLYRCYYKMGISANTTVNMDAYDISGESIIPFSTTPTKELKAGTWVGISASESNEAGWSVSDLRYVEVKKIYSCHYQKKGTPTTIEEYRSNCEGGEIIREAPRMCGSYTNNNGMPLYYPCYYCRFFTDGKDIDEWINQDPIEYNKEFTVADCKDYNGIKANEVKLIDDNKEIDSPENSTCKSEAISRAKGTARDAVGASSSKLEYLQEVKNEETGKSEIIPQKMIGKRTDFGEIDNGLSGSVWAKYSYFPEKVCINLKTAEITYNEKCIITNENKQMENGTIYDNNLKQNITYWYYFIPLTAKTDSQIYIKMIKDGEALSVNQCEDGMKKYKNYNQIIAPKEGSYIGDYIQKQKDSTDYKQLKADKGCNIAIIVNFKIKQEFYNEDNKKIKGYGTYFKPIDINNPFPNGINDKSYWKNILNTSNNTLTLIDANNKTTHINLNDSFESITYLADVSNTKRIKDYNKNYFYTSWEEMNINGSSNFINEGYVTRNGLPNYYKLGCGPSNINWKGCQQ